MLSPHQYPRWMPGAQPPWLLTTTPQQDQSHCRYGMLWRQCQFLFNPGMPLFKAIHVKERNAIFPFPESCPFFSESERKAGLIWKGRKGTGKERYDGAKFPFLSISDFPIWKTKFSISSKKVIKLGGHFLEFCITSNGRALVGALVGVMEGNFYHAKLTW